MSSQKHFKAGDRVRVVVPDRWRSGSLGKYYCIGDTGTVMRVSEGSKQDQLIVQFDQHCRRGDGRWSVLSGELELIRAPEVLSPRRRHLVLE